jgi:hypothetical protein
VLLHSCEAAHPLIVGIGFVVLGAQTQQAGQFKFDRAGILKISASAIRSTGPGLRPVVCNEGALYQKRRGTIFCR